MSASSKAFHNSFLGALKSNALESAAFWTSPSSLPPSEHCMPASNTAFISLREKLGAHDTCYIGPADLTAFKLGCVLQTLLFKMTVAPPGIADTFFQPLVWSGIRDLVFHIGQTVLLSFPQSCLAVLESGPEGVQTFKELCVVMRRRQKQLPDCVNVVFASTEQAITAKINVLSLLLCWGSSPFLPALQDRLLNVILELLGQVTDSTSGCVCVHSLTLVAPFRFKKMHLERLSQLMTTCGRKIADLVTVNYEGLKTIAFICDLFTSGDAPSSWISDDASVLPAVAACVRECLTDGGVGKHLGFAGECLLKVKRAFNEEVLSRSRDWQGVMELLKARLKALKIGGQGYLPELIGKLTGVPPHSSSGDLQDSVLNTALPDQERLDACGRLFGGILTYLTSIAGKRPVEAAFVHRSAKALQAAKLLAAKNPDKNAVLMTKIDGFLCGLVAHSAQWVPHDIEIHPHVLLSGAPSLVASSSLAYLDVGEEPSTDAVFLELVQSYIQHGAVFSLSPKLNRFLASKRFDASKATSHTSITRLLEVFFRLPAIEVDWGAHNAKVYAVNPCALGCLVANPRVPPNTSEEVCRVIVSLQQQQQTGNGPSFLHIFCQGAALILSRTQKNTAGVKAEMEALLKAASPFNFRGFLEIEQNLAFKVGAHLILIEATRLMTQIGNVGLSAGAFGSAVEMHVSRLAQSIDRLCSYFADAQKGYFQQQQQSGLLKRVLSEAAAESKSKSKKRKGESDSSPGRSGKARRLGDVAVSGPPASTEDFILRGLPPILYCLALHHNNSVLKIPTESRAKRAAQFAHELAAILVIRFCFKFSGAADSKTTIKSLHTHIRSICLGSPITTHLRQHVSTGVLPYQEFLKPLLPLRRSPLSEWLLTSILPELVLDLTCLCQTGVSRPLKRDVARLLESLNVAEVAGASFCVPACVEVFGAVTGERAVTSPVSVQDKLLHKAIDWLSGLAAKGFDFPVAWLTGQYVGVRKEAFLYWLGQGPARRQQCAQLSEYMLTLISRGGEAMQHACALSIAQLGIVASGHNDSLTATTGSPPDKTGIEYEPLFMGVSGLANVGEAMTEAERLFFTRVITDFALPSLQDGKFALLIQSIVQSARNPSAFVEQIPDSETRDAVGPFCVSKLKTSSVLKKPELDPSKGFTVAEIVLWLLSRDDFNPKRSFIKRVFREAYLAVRDSPPLASFVLPYVVEAYLYAYFSEHTSDADLDAIVNALEENLFSPLRVTDVGNVSSSTTMKALFSLIDRLEMWQRRFEIVDHHNKRTRNSGGMSRRTRSCWVVVEHLLIGLDRLRMSQVALQLGCFARAQKYLDDFLPDLLNQDPGDVSAGLPLQKTISDHLGNDDDAKFLEKQLKDDFSVFSCDKVSTLSSWSSLLAQCDEAERNIAEPPASPQEDFRAALCFLAPSLAAVAVEGSLATTDLKVKLQLAADAEYWRLADPRKQSSAISVLAQRAQFTPECSSSRVRILEGHTKLLGGHCPQVVPLVVDLLKTLRKRGEGLALLQQQKAMESLGPLLAQEGPASAHLGVQVARLLNDAGQIKESISLMDRLLARCFKAPERDKLVSGYGRDSVAFIENLKLLPSVREEEKARRAACFDYARLSLKWKSVCATEDTRKVLKQWRALLKCEGYPSPSSLLPSANPQQQPQAAPSVVSGGSDVQPHKILGTVTIPRRAKCHLQFARFLDQLLKEELVADRGRPGGEAVKSSVSLINVQALLAEVLLQYLLALKHGTKHSGDAVLRVCEIAWQVVLAPPSNRPDWKELVQCTLDVLGENFASIPAWIWFTVLPQLIPRLGILSTKIAEAFPKSNKYIVNSGRSSLNTHHKLTVFDWIVAKVVVRYPKQTFWQLAQLPRVGQKTTKKDAEFARADSLVWYAALQLSESKARELRSDYDTHCKAREELERLSRYAGDKIDGKTRELNFESACIGDAKEKEQDKLSRVHLDKAISAGIFCLPFQAYIGCPRAVLQQETLRRDLESIHNDAFMADVQKPVTDPLLVTAINPRVKVMQSKAKPKVVLFQCQDGQYHKILAKFENGVDMRKDSRVMDCLQTINALLAQHQRAGTCDVKMTTYAVVTVTCNCALIEWIENIVPVRAIVLDLWSRKGIPWTEKLLANAKKPLNGLPALRQYQEQCKAVPPVLQEWFLERAAFESQSNSLVERNLVDYSSWYRMRQRYIHTNAMWCMVGYILGLGDRHCENLLLHNVTGDLIHVDFECLFGKGMTLGRPETVPFRLTPNIVRAMGTLGVEGSFRATCERTMRILRDNREKVMSVLAAFVADPLIDWVKHGKGRAQDTAKSVVEEIDRKLKGMVNFGDGRGEAGDSDPLFSCSENVTNAAILGRERYPKLPVDAQVDKLIESAVSDANLSHMYVGWMPAL